jgi:hypothetical protein
MKFAFTDSNGQVMAVHESPKAPAPTSWETVHGYTRREVTGDVGITRDHKWNGSKFVVSVNPDQPVVTYTDKRVNAYPSIGDQLDMQYHDGVDGTTTWADAIAAVKTKYPKP